MVQQLQQPRSKASASQAAAPMRRQQPELTEAQRHDLIAEAAYLRAEQRGFLGDMALSDWLQAEADVNARYRTGRRSL